MAETKKINECTSLLANFRQNLMSKYFFDWEDRRTEDLYKVIWTSIANYLKFNASKQQKVAAKITDFRGNFLMCATLTYSDAADANDETRGNWNLEYSFDESDLDGITSVYDNMSAEFVQIIEREAKSIMGGRFTNPEYMHDLVIEAIQSLKLCLDNNAVDGDEFAVECPGMFVATVGVENGEKVFSIVPGAVAKQIIKEDSLV